MINLNPEAQVALKTIDAFLGDDDLRRQVYLAAAYFPDRIQHVLPSIALSGGGTVLERVFLISETLLGEVVLQGPGNTRFYFTHKYRVDSYSLITKSVKIKDADVVRAQFEIAELVVHLDSAYKFVCELNFAGTESERRAWLSRVMSALSLGLKVPSEQ